MRASNRIVRNTIYLYIKMGITLIVNLYSTRIALLYLGVDNYGLFGLVAGVINMLGVFNATFMHTTQRFINFYMGSGKKEELKKTFNNSILIHAFISVLVFLLMELAEYVLFEYVFNIEEIRVGTAKVLFQMMVITSTCTILTCPYDALINAHEHMIFYAITGLLESFIRLGIAFSLAFFTADRLIVFGVLMSSVSLIILFVKWQYCKIKYEECQLNLKFYFDKQQIKELTSFASWNLIGVSGIVIGNYGSGLVLNHFYGISVNAAHYLSEQIKGHLMAISNNFSKVVSPVITKKAGEGNLNAMLQYTVTSSKLYCFLFSLLALPFFIEGSFLLKVWLKDIPLWTLIFVRWNIIISWQELLILPFYTSLFAYGHIKGITIVRGFVHLMPIGLSILFSSFYHTPVLLYQLTFVCMNIITPVCVLFLMVRYYNFNVVSYLSKTFIPIFFLALIDILIFMFVKKWIAEGWIRLLIISFGMDVLFTLMMYSWVFNENEKQIIWNIILSFYKKLCHRLLKK